MRMMLMLRVLLHLDSLGIAAPVHERPPMNVVIEHAFEEDAVMVHDDIVIFVVELHLPQAHPDELAIQNLAVLHALQPCRMCR